METIAVSSWW